MKAIQLLLVPILFIATTRPADAQARLYNYKTDGPFTATETIAINGECIMCKYRIEGAAKKMSGVWHADWDIDTKNLLVKYHRARVSTQKIEQAVMATGHDTKNYRASDATYIALPFCCHYRRTTDFGGTEQ